MTSPISSANPLVTLTEIHCLQVEQLTKIGSLYPCNVCTCVYARTYVRHMCMRMYTYVSMSAVYKYVSTQHLCTYMYVCIITYVRAYVRKCTRTYIYIYIYIYIHKYKHIHIYICIHTYIYIYTYVWICVYVYIYIYMCTCARVHVSVRRSF